MATNKCKKASYNKIVLDAKCQMATYQLPWPSSSSMTALLSDDSLMPSTFFVTMLLSGENDTYVSL